MKIMRSSHIARRAGALLLCAALAAGTMTMAAGAATTSITAQLSPDISIVVDGAARSFYNSAGAEVHPILYNGTTYLPLRAIGELMDKNVNWDQANMIVSLSSTRTASDVQGTDDRNAAVRSVSAVLSSDITVLVDGVRQNFTDASGNAMLPLVYNGSIYLPLRAVAHLMGKTVGWDNDTSTVTLTSGFVVTDADSFDTTASTGSSSGGGTQTSSGTLISAEMAKNRALAHAGLSSSQVSFVRASLEWDDGRRVYDVEFYTSDYKEYDYEIDAYTGAVLSYDFDAEYYRPSTGSGSSDSYIGQDRAKSIALSYVSGASDANIRYARLDRDDGRTIYEVKIIYGTREYEFEIDAYTGTVLSRDVDSIYD